MPVVKKQRIVFNTDKYIKCMRHTIMEIYKVDKNTAAKAIDTSTGFQDAIRRDPSMAAHIPEELWAKKIWEGYTKRNIFNRY